MFMWMPLAAWLSLAAATFAIVFALIRISRGRSSAARSLLLAHQELERSQQLDRRRMEILEMVGAHAPLGTTLGAVADLAGQAHPGAGAAIWSVAGDTLLYQVSTGLPSAVSDLARTHVATNACLPADLLAAADAAALDCIAERLHNSAGDIIGLLAVFVPKAAAVPDAPYALSQLASLAIENTLLYERLAFQAQHDVLTGLPNRLLFQDRVQQAIHVARRNSQKLAVLWVDIDRFKHVNDTLGHRAGD